MNLLLTLSLSFVLAASTAAPGSLQPFASVDRFTEVWSSDPCLKQHGQSWDDYWSWVQRFYSGKDGWLSQSEGVISRIRDADTHEKRARDLELLGLRVSAEWSKANACRKIRTTTGLLNLGERGKPALSSWGKELRDAASRDNGDGTAIGAAIDDVTRQVGAVLGPAR